MSLLETHWEVPIELQDSWQSNIIKSIINMRFIIDWNFLSNSQNQLYTILQEEFYITQQSILLYEKVNYDVLDLLDIN